MHWFPKGQYVRCYFTYRKSNQLALWSRKTCFASHCLSKSLTHPRIRIWALLTTQPQGPLWVFLPLLIFLFIFPIIITDYVVGSISTRCFNTSHNHAKYHAMADNNLRYVSNLSRKTEINISSKLSFLRSQLDNTYISAYRKMCYLFQKQKWQST